MPFYISVFWLFNVCMHLVWLWLKMVRWSCIWCTDRIALRIAPNNKEQSKYFTMQNEKVKVQIGKFCYKLNSIYCKLYHIMWSIGVHCNELCHIGSSKCCKCKCGVTIYNIFICLCLDFMSWSGEKSDFTIFLFNPYPQMYTWCYTQLCWPWILRNPSLWISMPPVSLHFSDIEFIMWTSPSLVLAVIWFNACSVLLNMLLITTPIFS